MFSLILSLSSSLLSLNLSCVPFPSFSTFSHFYAVINPMIIVSLWPSIVFYLILCLSLIFALLYSLSSSLSSVTFPVCSHCPSISHCFFSLPTSNWLCKFYILLSVSHFLSVIFTLLFSISFSLFLTLLNLFFIYLWGVEISYSATPCDHLEDTQIFFNSSLQFLALWIASSCKDKEVIEVETIKLQFCFFV